MFTGDTVTERGGTDTAMSDADRTAPSKSTRRSRAELSHGSSLSLIATSAEARSTSSRGAYARRSAYQAGLHRPSPSTTDHDVTGQQSLSCHRMLPIVYGACERRCSTAYDVARAWLSCIAQ